MRFIRLAAVFVALFTVSTAASAQQAPAAPKLQVGEWAGSVTPPGGETAAVKYIIAYTGDTLTINIDAGPHGNFPTTETAFDGEKISFKFRPGPEIVCVLKKAGTDYTGSCTDNEGGVATIAMTPPAAKPAK